MHQAAYVTKICASVCMYVCMYVYMYMYICIYVCVYIYMYVYVYIYICLCICMYVYVYVYHHNACSIIKALEEIEVAQLSAAQMIHEATCKAFLTVLRKCLYVYVGVCT